MTSGFAGAERMSEALGGLIWLELELFEVVGAWVSPAAEPALKELFATQCYHHVWRAELLRPRLHAFGGVEPVGRIVPPNDRGPEFLVHLCDERDAVLRLAVLARVVLPGLWAAYSGVLAGCSAVSDGPTIRLAQKAIDDLVADWQQAELLIRTHFLFADNALDISRAVGEAERSASELFAAWRFM